MWLNDISKTLAGLADRDEAYGVQETKNDTLDFDWQSRQRRHLLELRYSKILRGFCLNVVEGKIPKTVAMLTVVGFNVRSLVA